MSDFDPLIQNEDQVAIAVNKFEQSQTDVQTPKKRKPCF